MYILKNAIISITRNKGRNILIGIIILVVSCASAVTLAIRNSAQTLIDSYEEKYDIVATIGIDRESMMKNFDVENKDESMENMFSQFEDIGSITVSEIIEYGTSEYVSSYYYTESIGMNSDEIETVSMDMFSSDDESNSAEDSQVDNNMNFGGKDMMATEVQTQSSGDFTLIGYSSYEAMEEFIDGTYSITEGEVSDDFTANYCVINSELATMNDLSVGDTITFTSPEDDSITYTLEITGIFTDSTDSSDSRMAMFSTSSNMIITNVTVIENIVSLDEDISNTITPSFVLVSKDVIDAFTEELTEKGLSESLTVSTNLDEVESATSSISNLKIFATTFLIITLIIGAVVLFVINMINIKERKYEIGVLRTIGMNKTLLTMQFVIELLIVAIIALIIGAAIGALISVPTANMLLENEITSSSSTQENIQNNFGKGSDIKNMENINGVTNIEQVDSINAVVDIVVLLELLGIGVLLTLVSSIASMISIQRFSPLTILKERS